MKRFGWKEFKQNGLTIPDSNGRLVITEGEDQHPYVNYIHTMKSLTFTLDGKVILKTSKDGWNPYVFFIDREYAIEKGIITQKTDTSYSAVLDGLYYLLNPIKIFKANGQIYATVIDKLRTRVRMSAFYYSKPTMDLRDAVYNHVKAKFMREYNLEENSQVLFAKMGEFLKDNNIYSIVCCQLSGKFIYKHESTLVELSGVRQYVDRNLNISDYNYSYDTTIGIWLRPDEAVITGYVYNIVTDTVCDCPTCSRAVPQSIVTEFGECKACAEQAYRIHNYSTKVPDLLKFKAKNVRPDTLYLGVELEYETTDRDVARMKVGKALKGHAIMKSDGSIRHGFEVVTCPATLDIQLDVFKLFYENKPKEITNGPSVGMHVHVSRKPLSTLTVGKLTEFMNRKDNSKFINYVAGRIMNTYCGQSDRTITFPITQRSGARYNALNLSNKDTIEFRIFSTPLTYEDFAAKVQFCQAIVEYAKPCNLGAALKQQTFYQTFINWVMPQRKSYPELVSKLKGFA